MTEYCIDPASRCWRCGKIAALKVVEYRGWLCVECRRSITGPCDHIPMKAALDNSIGCIRCGEWLGNPQ